MATASSKLQIIIDVLTGQSSQNVSKLEQGIDSLKTGIVQATVVIAALGFAAKKAFDIIKEGADLQLVEERFGRLAETIGTTGDAIMSELLPAMGFMVSDAEAMALATDLMSLGLVDSQDQLIRLAGVAGQLNMDMNQLVLTLTNMTTMRFDSLGVSVDGFTDKVSDLEAAGYSANDAFTEAFLQQAEAQLKKVGSAAEQTAGKIAQMESEWKNMADSVKMGMTNLAVGIYETVHATDLLREAQKAGLIDGYEYGNLVNLINEEVITEAELIEYLSGRLAENAEVTETAADAAQYFDEEMENAWQTADVLAESIEGVSAAALESIDAFGSMGDEMEGLDQKAYGLADAQEAINSALERSASAATQAMDAMQEYMGIFDDTTGAEQAEGITDAVVDNLVEQAEAAAAAGENVEPYLEMIRDLDPATAAAMEESTALSGAIEALDALYQSGKITGDEYTEAVENMTEGIKAGVDPTIAITTEMSKFRDIMSESDETAVGLKGSLDELTGGSPYTVEVITTYTEIGSPPSTGGGSSGDTTTTDGDSYSGDVAGGGYVYPGSKYRVGEKGEEWFVPFSAGEIIPNHDIGTAGGRAVNIYQTNQVTNTNPLTAAMNQAFIDSSLTAEFRGQL